ncbi:MAG TPA: citrate synthase [Actinomycetota bacterium]|nr:citrate synthase [Actinomycetota bacterium]
MGPAHGQRLSSAEAASRLGVKPATLYAYVSRGLLRSQRAPDGRTTTFDPAEVDRLARRGRRRGRLDPPGTATPPAVPPERSGVGEVVFASALTSIDGGVLRYRGLDASELAGRYSFEQVAGWLWTGRLGEWTRWRAEEAAVAAAAACQAALPAGTLPLDRLRVAAAALAAADELRFELHPEAVVTTGRALVAGLVDSLPELPPATAGAAVEVADGGRLHAEAVAARLWRRLSAAPPGPGMVDVLDVALVLAADHELAASAVAARVAASVQADPYAVVGAGLGSVSGALHGGLSLAAETLLAEIGTPERARRVIGDRLRWGEQVPGLGHSLYPDGDPRAACLLGWLGRAAAGSDRLAVVAAVVDAVRRRRLPAPNVDFALAGLAFVAGMTRGAAETVFAVGRIAGWLAHALEEYQRRTPIRPRARYTGPPPTPLPDLRRVGPAHRPASQ